MEKDEVIFWKGVEIGNISNIIMDMWYLEGTIVLNDSIESSKFIQLVKKFNPEEIITTPTKGTIITFKDPTINDINNFLVLSLDANQIFLRLVSEEIANWVKEKGY